MKPSRYQAQFLFWTEIILCYCFLFRNECRALFSPFWALHIIHLPLSYPANFSSLRHSIISITLLAICRYNVHCNQNKCLWGIPQSSRHSEMTFFWEYLELFATQSSPHKKTHLPQKESSKYSIAPSLRCKATINQIHRQCIVLKEQNISAAQLFTQSTTQKSNGCYYDNLTRKDTIVIVHKQSLSLKMHLTRQTK